MNELNKILSDKRRILRDEEAKLHEIERKIRDKQYQEKTIAERLKTEYEDLRGRFEQMAFELRFSIEDELRIYSRLLDELMKKSNGNNVSSSLMTTSNALPSTGSTSTVTYSTISSRIRSGGIEDQRAPTSYEKTRTTSSSGAVGTTFDLGNATTSSTWQDLGSTGGSIRAATQEFHEGGSVTRSSSYSNLS